MDRIYRDWNWYRKLWWFLHYLIGSIGVVASITAANKPQFLQAFPDVLSGIAWLSALCVTLLVFLEPKKRARAYAAAWRLLNTETGRFRNAPANTPPASLFDVIAQGEEFIAKLDG
ncbi:MAG TPA: hypothetical protein VNA69_07880 [Thermoanaerobaculia bacterium]|nr:hypothetical protein [Thermoanaerobaculia bacterium]